ncbi:MAG: L-seryl-tRNA(Sec) selenium transferase, partial [Nitriliruptoraceae bacterium]
VEQHGRGPVVTALRTHLDTVRATIERGGSAPSPEEIIAAAGYLLVARRRSRVTPVVNATGVVLHTNLGRAPLSAAARDAVLDAAGYATVEYDLDAGQRGSRTASLGHLAAEASGTEAATVVNNGAAALLLVLMAIATGRETIVSRGELIEIGGSYRLPDIMEISGSRLVEVGTTNRTRIADYERALSEETGMLLKVHRSNFVLTGFTAEASIDELAILGAERGVPVVYDVGSGLLRDADGPLSGEPSVEAAVRAGADLVIYSGDKLLGGPQAGIIAGRPDLVRRCTSHPMARAVRVDKLQRAALEATLGAHLRATDPVDVPVVAMLRTPVEILRERADRIAASVGPHVESVATESAVGGGSVPGTRFPSWGLAIAPEDPERFAARLRQATTPVIARIERGRVVLDLRTVAPSRDGELVGVLAGLTDAR